MIQCPRCKKCFSPYKKYDKDRKKYVREVVYRLRYKEKYSIPQITKIMGWKSFRSVSYHLEKIDYSIKNFMCYKCDIMLNQDSTCPRCKTEYIRK